MVASHWTVDASSTLSDQSATAGGVAKMAGESSAEKQTETEKEKEKENEGGPEQCHWRVHTNVGVNFRWRSARCDSCSCRIQVPALNPKP